MQASRFACTRSEYCKGFGNSLRSATVNSPTRSTPPPKEPAGSNARAIHGNVLNFGITKRKTRKGKEREGRGYTAVPVYEGSLAGASRGCDTQHQEEGKERVTQLYLTAGAA
eukprot:scaffold11217_cov21-Tisochrysis_lutea.AAC.2